MPYTESNAPAHVKKLPPKRKRQWLHVFNNSINSGDDEATAFAKANGVAAKEKTYVESWDVADRKLNKDESNYSVLGGLDGKEACAACRWFVSPDACVLVWGDISPIGTCDYYMDTPVVAQVAEVQVGSNEAALPLDKVEHMSIFDKIFGNKEKGVFHTVKQADGSTRFFVLASNNFKDRHKEIITAAAHKEFVEWCDEQHNYPELWLWHAKDSKIGEVDWIDSSDGMLVASGTLAEWAVPLAPSWKDLGVSHGFLGVTTKDGYVTHYRSYEISLLPHEKAANPITGVNFIEEAGMPFSEEKKTWLKSQVGDPTVVDQWEKSTDDLAKHFKDLGIEFKEVSEPTSEPNNEVMAHLAALTKAVGDLSSVVLENKNDVNAQVEQAFTARIKDIESLRPYVATEKEDNEPAPEVAAQVKTGGDNWFNTTVMGGILNGRS